MLLDKLPQQSKLASLAEALTGTVIGMLVTMVLNEVIFPAYGFRPSLWVSFQIMSWFTLASVVRGYFVRRVFNHPSFQRIWKRLFKRI